MQILLTNDDGIYAPGLLAMWRALQSLGQVHVVAPESVQSASGHAITLNSPLLTSRVTIDGAFTGTAVAGRPADCVKLAVSHLIPDRDPESTLSNVEGPALSAVEGPVLSEVEGPRPPKLDLVISGINHGTNVGINVIYSGTVAAAAEAAFLGLPAIAISQYLKDQPPDYAVAAAQSLDVIRRLLALGLRPGQVANINLPALAPGQQPAGIRVCRQCTNPWVDKYERRTDPRGREYFWNSSVFTLGQTDHDTDVAALRDGFITVTPLHYDLTDRAELANWQSKLK